VKDILLVEDDPNIAKSLIFLFEKQSLTTNHATSIKSAKELFEIESHDLFLFDIGLADGSGIELTKYIRTKESEKPIILITAMMDEDTLINGFEAGANDYIRKPFSNNELLARVNANLKRSQKQESQLCIKSLSLNLTHRICKYKESEIKLNRRQLDILYYLMKNEGQVISRDSLLQFLNMDNDVFDRTIDSHISQLRSKLKKSQVEDIKITSIYGVGYKFES
jgi:DNA-binding response OmpR family regulator